MIDNNRIPLAGGVWIDCYNQSVSDIAGTVLAGINSKNHYFVTDMERKVLGWTRDKRGKIVDRHAVDVANSVTATKRDNTQNYVVEPLNATADGSVTPALTAHTENTLRRIEDTNGIRIRKLTPRECFRLMGVKERDIDKIQDAGISKSQQYKLAGNSIVVNCLAAIFRQLFIGNFNKVV